MSDGRYEMVDESMAGASSDAHLDDDDDRCIYQPDQSVRLPEMGSGMHMFTTDDGVSVSARSCDPIMTGETAVTLKMIFNDPRWSPRQRNCFVASMGIFLATSLVLALFVGLFRTLSTITAVENMHKYGLVLTPNPHNFDSTLWVGEGTGQLLYTKRVAKLVDEYTRYEELTKKDDRFVDCSPSTDEATLEDKFCRPNVTDALDRLGCSAEKNYGYYHKDGQGGNETMLTTAPCILMQFVMPPDWTPSDGLKNLGADCVIRPQSNSSFVPIARREDANHKMVKKTTQWKLQMSTKTFHLRSSLHYMEQVPFGDTESEHTEMLPPLIIIKLTLDAADDLVARHTLTCHLRMTDKDENFVRPLQDDDFIGTRNAQITVNYPNRAN